LQRGAAMGRGWDRFETLQQPIESAGAERSRKRSRRNESSNGLRFPALALMLWSRWGAYGQPGKREQRTQLWRPALDRNPADGMCHAGLNETSTAGVFMTGSKGRGGTSENHRPANCGESGRIFGNPPPAAPSSVRPIVGRGSGEATTWRWRT